MPAIRAVSTTSTNGKRYQNRLFGLMNPKQRGNAGAKRKSRIWQGLRDTLYAGLQTRSFFAYPKKDAPLIFLTVYNSVGSSFSCSSKKKT
ncbi:MAG TPA: hypothetical protein VMW81_10425 [Nitrospinota bacterium]|nr:hypothetical protein [Nitrospinota bacterium]